MNKPETKTLPEILSQYADEQLSREIADLGYQISELEEHGLGDSDTERFKRMLTDQLQILTDEQTRRKN